MKKFPFWLALPLSMLATIILSNVLVYFYMQGSLTIWQSFGSPPTGVKKVLTSSRYTLWVETNEGQTYAYNYSCVKKNKKCRVWRPYTKPIKIDYGDQNYASEWAITCSDLSDAKVPTDPRSGTVKECVYAPYIMSEYEYENYFAVMTDGTVKYWGMQSDEVNHGFLLLISWIIMPILVTFLVSAIYLISGIVSRRIMSEIK